MYKILYPKTELMKKHIVNYDSMQNFDNTSALRYFVFPQKGTTVAILKNVSIETEGNTITLSKSKKENLKVLFFGKYLQPLQMNYRDSIDEIAVNFNETGINYFFSNPYAFQIIDAENIHLDRNRLFQHNEENSLTYLEDYLYHRYKPIQLQAVEETVRSINKNPLQSIQTLAEQVFLTEKTLHRQFQKHIGCSISKYKSILRFRNTIQTHFANSQQNLTALCLEHNFFDSPHFYKEIKKLAHFNPKDFFNKLQASGGEKYPYIFV